MIQRIQSVWLLIASVAAFLSLKLPFYVKSLLPANTYYELKGTENFLLMFLTIALATIAFINIFLFKNRKIQLRFCIVAIVLDIALIALYLKAIQDFSTGTFSFYWILHVVVIIALILAARAINRDEKMVQDSDRLR